MKVLVKNEEGGTIQEVMMFTNIPELGCKKKFNTSSSEFHTLSCAIPVYDEETGTDHTQYFLVSIGGNTVIIPKEIYDYFSDERFPSEDEFRKTILRYLYMQWRRELGNGLKKTSEEIWDLAIVKNSIDKFLIQVLVKSPTPEERMMIDAGMTAQVLERHDAYYKIHRDWIQREKEVDEFLKGESA